MYRIRGTWPLLIKVYLVMQSPLELAYNSIALSKHISSGRLTFHRLLRPTLYRSQHRRTQRQMITLLGYCKECRRSRQQVGSMYGDLRSQNGRPINLLTLFKNFVCQTIVRILRSNINYLTVSQEGASVHCPPAPVSCDFVPH